MDYYHKEKKQIFYCQNCLHNSEAFSSTNILTASNILFFSLNRGDLNDEYNQLLKIPFLLEENLNLSSVIKRPASNTLNYTSKGSE